jgi:hypothetical protein
MPQLIGCLYQSRINSQPFKCHHVLKNLRQRYFLTRALPRFCLFTPFFRLFQDLLRIPFAWSN